MLQNKIISKRSLFNKTKFNKAFSVVEILVVAPIVILVIGAFITAIVYMTGDAIASKAANNLAYNIQDALNKIEQDVALSGGYLSTNNISLSANQGYDGSTSDFYNVNSNNSVGSMLILNSYATTDNPLSSDRNLVFLRSEPNACDSQQINENAPLTLNVVYFIDSGTLWRRVLARSNYNDTNATTGYVCSNPWQKPTCQTTNAFCTVEDTKLIEGINVSDFAIRYYSASDQALNTTASDSSKTVRERQDALDASAVVEVEITVSINSAGRPYTHTGKIRATSPNNYAPTAPDAPTNLVATNGTGQVVLTWAAPTNTGDLPITNYKIYRGTTANGESTTPIATVGDVLTYTDTVGAGTYYYKITAVNDQRDSSFSNEASGTSS